MEKWRQIQWLIDTDAVDETERVLARDHAEPFYELLAASPFAAAALRRKPQWLRLLTRGLLPDYDYQSLLQAAGEAIAECADIEALNTALRDTRNQHMVCIALRDIAERDSLERTLEYLSDLADMLLAASLRWHYDKQAKLHGFPRAADGGKVPLVVLAMGKLGARELNFSSDIDLILAYEHDGETNGDQGRGKKGLSHPEFFLKVARLFSQSLSRVTADGFVYRVDFRLRPYGASGPMTMSFAAMEEYYQTQGREWERYALIKARPVGMDTQAGERLLALLKPFVYRRYIDFGVIQALRELKVMIDREVARKDYRDNIKLGAGGIREIEFIAQAFQLMRGGQEASLQKRSTPGILQRLAEKKYLPADAVAGLVEAWRFLRAVENHIQMMHDRQEHNLPKDDTERARLARSLGYEGWDAFVETAKAHRTHVQQCFDNVFARREAGDAKYARMKTCWLALDESWDDAREGEGGAQDLEMLRGLGYAEPADLLRRLARLKTQGAYRRLSAHGKSLMDELIPLLTHECGQRPLPHESITRLLTVVDAIAQRESYLSLLLESTDARAQLAKLCVASIWVTETIARYPALLDELIDPRALYAPPDKEQLSVELARLQAEMDGDDIEMRMDRLRRFKLAQQIRIAAADITGALPLMRVSDHLTWLAEKLVQLSLDMAWGEMTARHGFPICAENNKTRYAGIAVIGFGKLGGIELGYGSDLDLVFLHDSAGENQRTDGEKPIDNSVFFTRLAQRMMSWMSTRTLAGRLYEVDTRLRPNGESGMLVSSLVAFEDYQQNEAWTWEHQALVRSRPICGGGEAIEAFNRIKVGVIGKKRDAVLVRQEVLAMRRRMRDELDRSGEGRFDLKQGAGGIVDIEFMVQYIVLCEARRNSALLKFSDTIRLLESAARIGRIPGAMGERLIEAYQRYREALHHRVLQGLDSRVDAKAFAAEREAVKDAWLLLLAEQV